ncbi:AI-2E family transporter [Sphingobacteriales bacterium UPWRP_1]|nr:hypothetical protein BVG80_07085 [Sphingobacteriales bacterium TSM_CSM]PSJ72845.1 AI-2E family transporter [Sphingobacteriales bacterium UPWRP_1]
MSTAGKYILTGLLVVALGFLAFYLSTILTYMLMAAIFSILGRPIMDTLMRIKIGRFKLPPGFCALLTLLFFYLVIAGFLGVFLPLVVQEIQMIASIDFEALGTAMNKQLREIDEFILKYDLTLNNKSSTDILRESIASFVNMTNVSDIFSTFLGWMGNLSAAVFSVSFITYFFLTDNKSIFQLVLRFIPAKFEEKFHHVVDTTKTLLTRYFVGVLIQITLVGGLTTIGMLIFGVRYALLIGFFAAVMQIIPYLGPIIGMVFGLFVAITTAIEQDLYVNLLPIIIKVSAVYGVVHLLDNMFSQPIIFSNSIRAHPLEIFLVIWVAATFAGVPGMILAIPIYTVIRVIVTELIIEFNLFAAS